MLQTLLATPRRKIAWAAAGVIIILLAGLWLFSVRKSSTQKKADQNLAKTVFRQKIPQNSISAKTVGNKKIITGKIPDKPAAEIKSQQAPAAEPPTEPQTQITKTEQTKEEIAATAEAPTEPQAPIQIDQAEKEKAVAAEPPTEPQTQFTKIEQTKEEKAVTAETPTSQQAPIKIEQAEKEKTELPEQATTASLKPDSLPQTVPQQKAKPVPVVAKSVEQEIRREKWLLSQDGSKYTVQVVGVSSEKLMLEFIESNKVLKQNKIAYYESTFEGRPWFQLLYGIYPDKQAARLAANKLPENIRQAGPWIRRIAAVQKAIEK